MEKFYIDIKNEGKQNAGNKARADASDIFENNGYVRVEVSHSGKWNRRINEYLSRNNFVKKSIKQIHNNSIVMLQYPLYTRNSLKIISELKKRNCILIALIHDINGLRQQKENFQQEVILLNNIDYIISHNKFMTEILKENGVKSKFINLEIFDYLNKNNNFNNDKIKYSDDVVYAGNLTKEKSGFLYKINNEVKLNLYGVGYNGSNTNINYKGSFSPSELQKNLEGAYGLVWDGPSVSSCDGIYGQYMKYNNPHKLSLYIASNMPVIVWEDSAIAYIVKEKNLGITINSLNDIKNNLLEEQKYLIVKKNVELLGKELRLGSMLQAIIKNIEKEIFV